MIAPEEPPRLAASEAHHAFIGKLDDVCKEFAGRLPPEERLAILAQHLGQCIAELPDHFDPGSVMASVGANMAAGNKAAADRGKHAGLITGAH